MYLRPRDRLFLHQYDRATFNLAADTKGIDALITDGLLCVRPHNLPMIILRTVIDGLQRLSVGGKRQQIETPVAGEIRRARNQRRSRCLPKRMLEQNKFTLFVRKPDQCPMVLRLASNDAPVRHKSSAPLLSRSA